MDKNFCIINNNSDIYKYIGILILFLILIFSIVYYLYITKQINLTNEEYDKIIEKLSMIETFDCLHKQQGNMDVKFRNCVVYFSNNKQLCDKYHFLYKLSRLQLEIIKTLVDNNSKKIINDIIQDITRNKTMRFGLGCKQDIKGYKEIDYKKNLGKTINKYEIKNNTNKYKYGDLPFWGSCYKETNKLENVKSKNIYSSCSTLLTNIKDIDNKGKTNKKYSEITVDNYNTEDFYKSFCSINKEKPSRSLDIIKTNIFFLKMETYINKRDNFLYIKNPSFVSLVDNKLIDAKNIDLSKLFRYYCEKNSISLGPRRINTNIQVFTFNSICKSIENTILSPNIQFSLLDITKSNNVRGLKYNSLNIFPYQLDFNINNNNQNQSMDYKNAIIRNIRDIEKTEIDKINRERNTRLNQQKRIIDDLRNSNRKIQSELVFYRNETTKAINSNKQIINDASSYNNRIKRLQDRNNQIDIAERKRREASRTQTPSSTTTQSTPTSTQTSSSTTTQSTPASTNTQRQSQSTPPSSNTTQRQSQSTPASTDTQRQSQNSSTPRQNTITAKDKENRIKETRDKIIELRKKTDNLININKNLAISIMRERNSSRREQMITRHRQNQNTIKTNLDTMNVYTNDIKKLQMMTIEGFANRNTRVLTEKEANLKTIQDIRNLLSNLEKQKKLNDTNIKTYQENIKRLNDNLNNNNRIINNNDNVVKSINNKFNRDIQIYKEKITRHLGIFNLRINYLTNYININNFNVKYPYRMNVKMNNSSITYENFHISNDDCIYIRL